MDPIHQLSDIDLRNELIRMGFNAGPVTSTTRKVYEKKLDTLRKNGGAGPGFAKTASKLATPAASAKTNVSAAGVMPQLPSTPLSAKRKGRKPQQIDTESSDNELDLTVSSSINGDSPRATRTAANRRIFPDPAELEHSPPRSNAYKRTPTPPRSAGVNKRTPLRLDSDAKAFSLRGNIFANVSNNGGGGDFASSMGSTSSSLRKSNNSMSASYSSPTGPAFGGATSTAAAAGLFGRNAGDSARGGNLVQDGVVVDDADDDHMETSRIVPRFNPFETSHTSGGGFGDFRSSGGSHFGAKSSPMDRIRRISQGAWGFFSRPTNAATPCGEDPAKAHYHHDVGSPAFGRTTTTTRYGRFSTGKYSPNQGVASRRSSSSLAKGGGGDSVDVSGWIVRISLGFLVLLVLLYLLSANPNTIEKSKNVVIDIVSTVFNFCYSYLILPIGVALTVVIITFGVYQFNKFRVTKERQHKEKVMALVGRITEVIRDQENDGIAELHVRDMLLPPTKRTQADRELWREAANFINDEDSRVRTEIRLVDGDECNVWVWLPVASKQKWQGTAIAESSLAQNIPCKALTRCIKLRGLSFTDRLGELEEIRMELLQKLSPIVPIHMKFTVQPENVVYMMLKDLDDAKTAFMAFHSHWFNSAMISAKYLRDERYMERFPDAKNVYKT